MSLTRRTVLRAGVAAAGAAAGTPAASASPSAGPSSGPSAGSSATGSATPSASGAPVTSPAGYVLNRAPLQPAAFLRLPPGAVRASGWLATQLDREVDGLCGRLPEVSAFLDHGTTGWIHPGEEGWEEVPYWLRGFVDLGYVTGDAGVRATAQKWISGVLATATSDGYFGPTRLRTSLNGHLDPWPHMPMLHALRSAAEVDRGSAVTTLLTSYFGFLGREPKGAFSESWGALRWGDTIDVVQWLYNRTGEAFLLDLVDTIHTNSADWVNGVPSLHNVNVAQGFREPAQYWVNSGDAAHRTATYTRYTDIQDRYGQFPGGGFAGDEVSRPAYTDPRQGFETCGIVEYMLSHEILTRLTGDPVWADRTEDLAFNSLPASLDPLGRVCHYVTSANSIDLDNAVKAMGQFSNHTPPMQSYRPGITQYRCCPHNYGMGWPYFVEEMWLATPDGGLCAALYGPCRVTARVTGGVPVTVTETTGYPFSDTVTLALALPRPVTFPLLLRIPGWCTAPQVRVNGTAVAAPGGGPRFLRIARTWSAGDVVTLRMPMAPVRRTWATQHNAMSVNFGALTFSLGITEKWVQTGGTAQWPEWEVHPGSAWNYGLVPGAAVTVEARPTGTDPFTAASTPVRLTTSAQRIPGWQADAEHVVMPLANGPVAASTPVERVRLIPMGAARLRITTFPQTGGTARWSTPPAALKIYNRNSGKLLGVDGMSLGDSANVVQYEDNGTSDHLWRLVDAGDGAVKIQNTHSGKLLAVEHMSTANSARVQQFDDNGTADHLWQFVDGGSGYLRIRNVHTGKVLGISGMSTANSAQAVQFDDNGTADHDWLLIPAGPVKLRNAGSGKVLAVEKMSTADSARVQQFDDNGSEDHLWRFTPGTDGSFRVENLHSGKVLAVAGTSTADSAQVVQITDDGTPGMRWRIRIGAGAGSMMRLQNVHSGKVLAVHAASTADSADVEQYADNGAPDHNWQVVL